VIETACYSSGHVLTQFASILDITQLTKFSHKIARDSRFDFLGNCSGLRDCAASEQSRRILDGTDYA
jgi:hypothetical protein